MDLGILEEVWGEQKRFLRDGLLDGAVWNKDTGLPISSYGETRNEFIALFSQVIDDIDDTLLSSGFSGLNRFLVINLAASGIIVAIIKHDNGVLQGMSLDPKRVNLGILFNVAIPKALAKVKQASA